jgi:hypothetical protein
MHELLHVLGTELAQLDLAERRDDVILDEVFQFTARLLATSTEYTTLVNQTTGTATLTVQHDANNSVSFTFPQMAFQMAENAEADGIVAVTVTGAPQYNTTANNVMSAVTKCGINNIAQ